MPCMSNKWPVEYVTAEKKETIAYLTITRPEAMNALNKTVIGQLRECFDRVEMDPDVKTIVIGGLGKAFVAGADIAFFIRCIKEGRAEDLESFANEGHGVLDKIEKSEKLVIARVQGLALGGGLELALACDTIIASNNASFGLPETGIGIYPGFGGMQRSMRKVGKALAKYLVLTGKVVDAATALDMGLIEYVVPRDDLDRKIDEVAESRSTITKKNKGRPELPGELARIEKLFDDNHINKLLSGEVEEGDVAGELARTIAKKAPLAIQKANELMDRGENMSLRDALELEKSDIKYIFATEDALEGLLSVGKRKPDFNGK